MSTHPEHDEVLDWEGDRRFALAGHAAVETYSVLTRLAGHARLAPDQAALLMAARFDAPLLLSAATAARLPERLAALDIAGGAVCDALVALAAVEHDATLASRDARARETYERVGATVVMVR